MHFALGTVAASFFVEVYSSYKYYRPLNKKDIADGPTLAVTPKLFFEYKGFLYYESTIGLHVAKFWSNKVTSAGPTFLPQIQKLVQFNLRIRGKII